MKEHVKEWLIFIGGAILACANDIIGVIVVFSLLFAIDFITGIAASFCKGGKIESHKSRWGFAKTLCYFGTFGLTLFFKSAGSDPGFFDYVLKLEIYVAAYIECVSILENMVVIFPKHLFFKYLHYMLTIEWVKKISGLKEFLKEHKSNNTNEDDKQTTT